MKPSFWKLSLVTGCVCASGLIATATSLQRADVMADPGWLLHVDCDALRPTAIGQHILSEMDKPEAKAQLAAMQAIFNIDLRNQVHGVTLYGGNQTPEDAVVIAYADFDAGYLASVIKNAKEYDNTTHNKHVIHHWTDDKPDANGDDKIIYAALQGNRIILGQREAPVTRALDVLDGSTPNLGAGKSFPELGVTGNTHFVEAAARKLSITNSDPAAVILKLAKSLQLVVGEREKQIQGNLTLLADTDEVAGNIRSIGDGLMSLLKLQTDNPLATKIAKGVTIKQDGDRVLGSITLPGSDVVEFIKADAAKKTAEQAAKEKK